MVVKAWDLAGNSVTDDINLEILPIPSPNITFVTAELFSDEERGLTVKGTALPGLDVLLRVWQLLDAERGEMVVESIALADEKGVWETTFDKLLRNGRYVVAAQSRDVRGALSLMGGFAGGAGKIKANYSNRFHPAWQRAARRCFCS